MGEFPERTTVLGTLSEKENGYLMGTRFLTCTYSIARFFTLVQQKKFHILTALARVN